MAITLAVINRNINFTNVCYMGCKFCGFAKRIDEAGAEWISVEQVVKRAEEAWNRVLRKYVFRADSIRSFLVHIIGY